MTVRELHPDPYDLADDLERAARARRRLTRMPADGRHLGRRPCRRRGLTPHVHVPHHHDTERNAL